MNTRKEVQHQLNQKSQGAPVPHVKLLPCVSSGFPLSKAEVMNKKFKLR